MGLVWDYWWCMYFVVSVVFWERFLSCRLQGLCLSDQLPFTWTQLSQKVFADSVCYFCHCHVSRTVTHLREQMNVVQPLMLVRECCHGKLHLVLTRTIVFHVSFCYSKIQIYITEFNFNFAYIFSLPSWSSLNIFSSVMIKCSVTQFYDTDILYFQWRSIRFSFHYIGSLALGLYN